MNSYQSSLGEGEGIAEELAESQRAISIAEFFEKNKHMLGFDSEARALVTAVKEAVDNAFDATEEAGILPDVYVEIEEVGDYYRLVVEDNGPGITKEQLPKVFGKLLYGSRFHVREQTRGQQGIGISAAVLYAQLTSGKPAQITSRTRGDQAAQYFELIVDTDTNEPKISEETTTSWERPHGTRVVLEMEANMRARQQLHDYVRHAAVVNPHARIEMREPDAHLKYERATDQLPEETEEIRPHPHGIELGTLIKMAEATDSYSLSGFLQSEFTRVGATTAEKVIDNFRDRHFGREMAWRPPGARVAARTTQDGDGNGGGTDVDEAVEAAVANKGREATADFAATVADRVGDADRVAHHDLVGIVDEVAGEIEADHDARFGGTVRENAIEAAWEVLTADRSAALYTLVDGATTERKDDAVIVALAERIAAKFDGERDRVTRGDIREYVDRAADMTADRDGATVGETARENVTDAIWGTAKRVPDDPPRIQAVAADRDTASELLEAMRETDIIAPPTGCLSPITADLVEAGLRKGYDADFYAATTRDASVHGGDPFIVEAGIAYGGDLPDDGTADVLRFANRVPLVYQRGACATTGVVKSINWRNYGLDQPGGSGLPNGPAVIMIHVASTNVPFTSESKDAVASVPEIENEIELAIREAARDLKSYLNRRRSMQQRREKQSKLGTILPEMAEKLATVTGRDPLDVDDTMARIMNNVLVEQERSGDSARLTVENNAGTNADLEVTAILSAEPGSTDGATVVEMDGEWFLKWSPTVESGDDASLEYSLPDGADCTVSVEGIDDRKLTVDAPQ
jgi:DNA topoisomerase-6 subunit B